MTKDDKMLLTGFLEEKLHIVTLASGTETGLGSCGFWHKCSCDPGRLFEPSIVEAHRKNNRTFITWQDLGDLKEKLAEKGMWEEFEDFTCAEFRNGKGKRPYRFPDWLLNPSVFIPLAVEFLRKEKV